MLEISLCFFTKIFLRLYILLLEGIKKRERFSITEVQILDYLLVIFKLICYKPILDHFKVNFFHKFPKIFVLFFTFCRYSLTRSNFVPLDYSFVQYLLISCLYKILVKLIADFFTIRTQIK